MSEEPETLADRLGEMGDGAGTMTVRLSYELVQLLSEQLYHSPAKAIEELVVNAFDADAPHCRVWVPADGEEDRFVAVFDDGVGMDANGLTDLWHIGRSNKRSEKIELLRSRKQIGKFGIGKLASYSIARRVTYISKVADSVLGVAIDFECFKKDPQGAVELKVPMTRLRWDNAVTDPVLGRATDRLGVTMESLGDMGAWTLVLLESLKPRSSQLTLGRLRYVLSTAMPLRSGFELFLNGEPVGSAKSELERYFSFDVRDLPGSRLQSILEKTGVNWQATDDGLASPLFPSGVRGFVEVTRASLKAGKSADLGRSHGFFVKVRGRLVAEEDPLFGLHPLSHSVWNRFRAEVDADDLDASVKAPREGVEESELKEQLKELLNQLFNHARELFEGLEREQAEKESHKSEEDRNYVNPRLMEHPVADVLGDRTTQDAGSEADESWFYLTIPAGEDLPGVLQSLYSTNRRRISFRFDNLGRKARLVRLDPRDSVVVINQDHDFVRAHEGAGSQFVLQDFATAEALLEVYLREHEVPPHTIGAVLEKRDALLRSLANDRLYSVEAISASLRDSKSDERDLEMALIGAARALGFVATHLSGAGKPDGLARFTDYPAGEKKIVLEAKASAGVPSLQALDIAGIAQHMKDFEAEGALLVAPAFPGETLGADSQISKRAAEARVSCWTVDLLADVVRSAESRMISATSILDVVLTAFSPEDVVTAVKRLLREPAWDRRDLYVAIIQALASLANRLPDSDRTVQMVGAEVTRAELFSRIESREIREAVREMAHASQGIMALVDDRIRLTGSIDELERRLDRLTGQAGAPRRLGGFHENGQPCGQ